MQQLPLLSAFVEQAATQKKIPATPENLYDPLRYFLSIGGKRMRPILTLMAAQAFGVEKEESIHAGLAIEFFHNFSLIHDDIMDKAPVRRGMQTVHEKWNSSIAILSGDVLLVEAYQQLLAYPDQRLAPLLLRFNQTAIEVCEGQQMDMDFEERADVHEDEYIEMIRLKTSVLLGCALEFGAILAHQSEETRKRIYDFGVELGIAFQIQDDILDLYADPEKFGKQVGGDILSNKKTLLMLRAKHLAESNNDPRFDALIQMPSNDEKIEFAKSLFIEIGAVAAVTQVMNDYYNKAMSDLDALPISAEMKAPLIELAEYLLNREH